MERLPNGGPELFSDPSDYIHTPSDDYGRNSTIESSSADKDHSYAEDPAKLSIKMNRQIEKSDDNFYKDADSAKTKDCDNIEINKDCEIKRNPLIRTYQRKFIKKKTDPDLNKDIVCKEKTVDDFKGESSKLVSKPYEEKNWLVNDDSVKVDSSETGVDAILEVSGSSHVKDDSTVVICDYTEMINTDCKIENIDDSTNKNTDSAETIDNVVQMKITNNSKDESANLTSDAAQIDLDHNEKKNQSNDNPDETTNSSGTNDDGIVENKDIESVTDDANDVEIDSCIKTPTTIKEKDNLKNINQEDTSNETDLKNSTKEGIIREKDNLTNSTEESMGKENDKLDGDGGESVKPTETKCYKEKDNLTNSAEEITGKENDKLDGDIEENVKPFETKCYKEKDNLINSAEEITGKGNDKLGGDLENVKPTETKGCDDVKTVNSIMDGSTKAATPDRLKDSLDAETDKKTDSVDTNESGNKEKNIVYVELGSSENPIQKYELIEKDENKSVTHSAEKVHSVQIGSSESMEVEPEVSFQKDENISETHSAEKVHSVQIGSSECMEVEPEVSFQIEENKSETCSADKAHSVETSSRESMEVEPVAGPSGVGSENMELDDTGNEQNDKKTSEPSNPESTRPVSRSASVNPSPINVQGRTTRMSQDPVFAEKHRRFLSSVHNAMFNSDKNDMDELLTTDNSVSEKSNENQRTTRRAKGVGEKRRRQSQHQESDNDDHNSNKSAQESDSVSSESPSSKKRKLSLKNEDSEDNEKRYVLEGNDRYCWRCHRDGNTIKCKTCPRVYHLRCTQLESVPTEDWVCPECTSILYAENTETRSQSMKSLTLDQLCNLLKYTVLRMKSYTGSEWFCKPVDLVEFPEYPTFVIRPMDLTLIEKNIRQKRYGSTEAFMAEAKWIVHNSIVFNTLQSKLTNIAKSLLKICKQELTEIETCPDCYLNAHTRKDSWFIEICRRPHIIVWAKLKGFPFWPAKAMRTNSENQVDVRFFGAHDRAWVPVANVFLYSRTPPAFIKNKKKNNLDECIMEVEQHIKKLKDKYGKYEYSEVKMPYDPENEDKQLNKMLPGYIPTKSGSNQRVRIARTVTSGKNTEASLKKLQTPCSKDDKSMSDDSIKSEDKSDEKEKDIREEIQNLISISNSSPSNKNKNDTKESNLQTSNANHNTNTSCSKDSQDIINISSENEDALMCKSQSKDSNGISQMSGSEKNVQNSTNMDVNKTESKNVINSKSETNKSMKRLNNDEIDDGNRMKVLRTYQHIKKPKVGSIIDTLKTTQEESEKKLNSLNSLSIQKVVEAFKDAVSNSNSQTNNDDCPQSVETTGDVSEPVVIEYTVKNDENVVVKQESVESSAVNVSRVVDSGEKSTASLTKDLGNQQPNPEKMLSNKLSEISVIPISSVDDKSRTIAKNTSNISLINKQQIPLNIVQDKRPGTLLQKAISKIYSENNFDRTSIINRRKSKPVKIRSRLNTPSSVSSCSDDTGEEFKKICDEQDGLNQPTVENQSIEEILDEVSGRFKKKDSNDAVTITLVNENDNLKSSTFPKKLCHSVTLTRDISMTVVETDKEIPTTLEMECTESDPDEQAPSDITTSKMPKILPVPLSLLKSDNNSRQVQSNFRINTNNGNSNGIGKTALSKLPMNFTSTNEIQISNTMSMKLQPSASTSTAVNGILPKTVVTNPANSNKNLENTCTNQSQASKVSVGVQFSGPPSNESGDSSLLDNWSEKLTMRFKSMVEEYLQDLARDDNIEAKFKLLQLEVDEIKKTHRQQMDELQHNHNTILMETRCSFDSQIRRAVLETRMQCDREKDEMAALIKKRRWCAVCSKEALFYCCRSAAYCNHQCQQAHWPDHMMSCDYDKRSVAARNNQNRRNPLVPATLDTSKRIGVPLRIKPTASLQ